MIARNQEAATDPATVDPAGPTPSAQEYLSTDQIFHLLQNERRRLALTYLQGREGPVEMRDVAEQVAAWEHETTVEALDSDQRQRVYIPLYQNHLPKLDEDGVIDYDQSRGIVERTPVADQLDPYLTANHERGPSAASGAGESSVESPAESDEPAEQQRWPRYYLATAVGGTVLLGAAAAGVPVVGDVSAMLVALVVVFAFAALTAVHVATTSTDGTDR